MTHDDETIYHLLEDLGIEPSLCNRLIQFIPMVFTRYAFQHTGIQFASEFRTMDAAGKVSEPTPLVENPVFLAVRDYCDSQPAAVWQSEPKTAIAARSSGYRSIVQIMAEGLRFIKS